MTNIEQEKQQIYDLLFTNWSPEEISDVRPEIITIIRSFFTKGKESMPLAELNYNITQCIHHITDYIEMSLPEVDINYAHKIAKRFVIKAIGIGNFWKQLSEMGIITDSFSKDMV